MSQPEPEPDAEEIEDVPDTELQDPDDYHRRQRLKEIHQRRQQVHKVIDDIDRYASEGDHNRQKKALIDAVIGYITELEPLIQKTEASPELVDRLPWDDVSQYADKIGTWKEDGKVQEGNYAHHIKVFRACNQYLAEIRPLIEEDDTDEWEV